MLYRVKTMWKRDGGNTVTISERHHWATCPALAMKQARERIEDQINGAIIVLTQSARIGTNGRS